MTTQLNKINKIVTGLLEKEKDPVIEKRLLKIVKESNLIKLKLEKRKVRELLTK
jgi:hypothetical protein